MTGSGENQPLLDIIVKALEPYDIPTGSWAAAEKVEPAKAVLDALRLRVVCRGCHSNPCRSIKPTAHSADYSCYRLGRSGGSDG